MVVAIVERQKMKQLQLWNNRTEHSSTTVNDRVNSTMYEDMIQKLLLKKLPKTPANLEVIRQLQCFFFQKHFMHLINRS